MYRAVKYNPAIHHRRSIRLKGYDYSRPGMYFITICVQQKECLFGEIKDAKMNVNEAGKMVEKWYFELENKFPDIKCHAMVVMPNHFHCIIENTGAVGNNDVNDVTDDVSNNDPNAIGNGIVDNGALAGADPRVCPYNNCEHGNPEKWGEHGNPEKWGEHGNPEKWGEHGNPEKRGEHGNPEKWGEHAGSPLQRVVQWFKTMTTNAYIRGVKNLGWKRFNGKLWQRNYYEIIIRNQKSYQTITKYIHNNPAKWKGDQLK